jgi:hypothetical protein
MGGYNIFGAALSDSADPLISRHLQIVFSFSELAATFTQLKI